jgi:hypothetical protein
MTHRLIRAAFVAILLWTALFSPIGVCAIGDCWSACEDTCADHGGLIAACECSWLGNDCGCLCADSGMFSCDEFPGCTMAAD